MMKTGWYFFVKIQWMTNWKCQRKAFIWNVNLIELYIYFNVDQINESFLN